MFAFSRHWRSILAALIVLSVGYYIFGSQVSGTVRGNLLIPDAVVSSPTPSKVIPGSSLGAVRPSCVPISDASWRVSGATYSQHELDVRMKRFLTGTHGFYIESGAFDGISASNTYIYSLERCWSGILVEPSPGNARAAAANRPGDIVEHSALVGPDHVGSVIRGAFDGGLMSKVDSAGGIDVPAHTMSALLEKHHVQYVHWWSLDVEGFEMDVLRGLDFSRWTPDYILVELWHDNAEVKNFLAERGYTIEADISPWRHATAHRDVLFRSSAATSHQVIDDTFTYDHLPWYD